MTIKPPAMVWNHKLLLDLQKRLNVQSRWPAVSTQAQALHLDVSKLPANAYNASIWWGQGHLWLSYRYHYAADNYRTKIGIAEINDSGTIIKTQELHLGDVPDVSYEDARLFTLQGEMWMSWVEATWQGRFDNPKSKVVYSRMEKGPTWEKTRVYQPQAGGNGGTFMQKNWVFFESDENLFCIFESWKEHVVFQLQGEKVVNEYRTPGIRWPYGPIRGGNVVPWEGKLLRSFHSSTEFGIGNLEKRYYVGFAVMNPKPPFEMLSFTQKPSLYGSELPAIRAFHVKPNVVFPCGLMSTTEGVVLACGINDALCALVKVRPNL
jgi:predicted GH43/DUF377 family glycosyl hydrolase